MTKTRSLRNVGHATTRSDLGDDVPRGWAADDVAYEDDELVSAAKADRVAYSGLTEVLRTVFFCLKARLQAVTDDERLVETGANWVPIEAESNWLS